jgi:hypothetical protein
MIRSGFAPSVASCEDVTTLKEGAQRLAMAWRHHKAKIPRLGHFIAKLTKNGEILV